MTTQKMLSCICGNTELEKVGVNLLRSNDAESLELTALVCRGNGCGRVTFRPNDMPKTKQEPVQKNGDLSNRNGDAGKADVIKHVIALFEQVYTERLVYKVIAEREPGCAALVDALKADPAIRGRITRTFKPIYDAVEHHEDFLKLLESLPSTGSKKQATTVELVAE